MKRIMLVTILILIPIATFTLYAQTTDPAAPADVPYVLFVPYLLGIIVHWGKKYTMDGVTANLWTWITQNFFSTIVSVVIGIGSLATMYGTDGHGGLFPVTVASWVAAFWVGFGSDSLNNAGTEAVKKG